MDEYSCARRRMYPRFVYSKEKIRKLSETLLNFFEVQS